MPWSRNPLRGKDRARNRKQRSQAEYSDRSAAAADNASEMPATAKPTGFDANRGKWVVATKSGKIMADTRTYGAIANAALIDGAGRLGEDALVYREAIAQPVRTPRKRRDNASEFGILYAVNLYKYSDSGEATLSLSIGFSHDGGYWHTLLTGGTDTWLVEGGTANGTAFVRVFALSSDTALVVLSKTVSSAVVGEAGGFRMSVFVVDRVLGVTTRSDYEWNNTEYGASFDWTGNDYARFLPLTKYSLITEYQAQVEIDTGYTHQRCTFEPYDGLIVSGGFNQDEEYLRIANFGYDYPAFAVLGATEDSNQYPHLYNIFSNDSRAIEIALNGTWVQEGDISTESPPNGITIALNADISTYAPQYVEPSDSYPTTSLTTGNLIGANSTIIADIQSGISPDTVGASGTGGMYPAVGDWTALDIINNGWQIEWYDRKPYRIS